MFTNCKDLATVSKLLSLVHDKSFTISLSFSFTYLLGHKTLVSCNCVLNGAFTQLSNMMPVFCDQWIYEM